MEKENVNLPTKTFFSNLKNAIISKCSYLEHDLYEICGVEQDRIREVLMEEIVEAVNSVETFHKEENTNESSCGGQQN